MTDQTIAQRVVSRFKMAFKYKPKEKKRSKVQRLMKLIRDKTGLGRGTAEDLADAVVRNRDIPRLTRQKSWPIEDGVIQGPQGELPIQKVQEAL